MKIGLALLIVPFGAALAYEPERAVTNLAHELAECAGFYTLSGMAFEVREPEIAGKSRDIGETAFYYSKELTNEKVTRARTEMAVNR